MFIRIKNKKAAIAAFFMLTETVSFGVRLVSYKMRSE